MKEIRSYRIVLDRSVEGEPVERLTNPHTVGKLAHALIKDEPVEAFFVVLLDAQNGILPNGIVSVSRGTLNCSLIHPREVFSPAVCARAAAVICFHNHPSGKLEPSPDDRTITAQLVAAGELLDIPLFDHIIVGPREGAYFSFAENGDIKPQEGG